MAQSLIQLPKGARFNVGLCFIIIHDHKIINTWGLLGHIMWIIEDSFSDRETLYQFEKHGVNFETAIECCAQELEDDTKVLVRAIYNYHRPEQILYLDERNYTGTRRQFSASPAGRIIAGQLIDKIRSCDDWGDLYDKLHPTSEFWKEMGSRIKRDTIQWHNF